MKRSLWLGLVALAMPTLARAATLTSSTIGPKDTNGTDFITSFGSSTTSEQSVLTTLFGNILTIATLLAGILAVAFIIYNGILYIMAAGEPEKTKKARGNILNIMIGIIIIVCAYAIISFAQGLGGLATNL